MLQLEASCSDSTDCDGASATPGKRGRGRGRGASVKQHKTYNCKHCDHLSNTWASHIFHVMSKHSLMPTSECPDGEDNARLIIVKLGYVSCQKCMRRFKNPQYYKHHTIWCGRENEQYFCPLCNKNTKSMWEYQHTQYHRLQERQKAQAEKQRQEKEEEEDGGDEEGGSKGTMKSARKAAKSALSLITSLDKGENAEGAKDDDGGSGKDFSDDGDEDTDDDDDDTDDEDDDEEDFTDDQMISGVKNKKVEKHGKKKKKKRRKIETGEVKTGFQFFNKGQGSEKDIIWKIVCHDVKLPSLKYLNHFMEEAKRMENLFLFDDLVLCRSDWTALADGSGDKYLPPQEYSQPFTSGTEGKYTGDPVKLAFGESASVNEKTFCYTGGPIWAMEWCPLPPRSGHPEVLALASDRQTRTGPGMLRMTKGRALIQFWLVENKENKNNVRLSFGLAHNAGYVRSMAWCPDGGFSPRSQENKEGSNGENEAKKDDDPLMKRLGLLAVACSNSNILIYSIPQVSRSFPTPTPSSTTENTNHHRQGHRRRHCPPVFCPTPIKLVLNSLAQATPCLSVSWQKGNNCRYILGGFGDGQIAMWDLSTKSHLLRIDAKTFRPVRMFSQHRMSILALSWCPSQPTHFASCSYDGVIYLWHVDSPFLPLGQFRKSGRGPVRSLCWASPFHEGLFSVTDKRKIFFPTDPEIGGKDSFQVAFHGFAPCCPNNIDFSAAVYAHPDSTWDVTFNPLYEVMASCDNLGNVVVVLPELGRIRTRRKLPLKFLLQSTPLMRLYKVCTRKPLGGNDTKKSENVTESKEVTHLSEDRPQPVVEDPTTSKVSSDQTIVTDNSADASTTTNQIVADVSHDTPSSNPIMSEDDQVSEDVDSRPRDVSEPVAMECSETSNVDEKENSPVEEGGDHVEQVILFNECNQRSSEMDVTGPRNKPALWNPKLPLNEKDDFDLANLAAVHRVRLRCSLDQNIWLASGGEMGLLRIDNVMKWVKGHRRKLYKELKKLKMDNGGNLGTES